MTVYYVDSTATGGANTGGNGTDAFLTYAQGITAANANGDYIYVSHVHAESLAADTTYTFLANIATVCVNFGTGAPATTAVIGAQAGNFAITLVGAKNILMRGIEFKTGSNNTTPKSFTIGNSDGAHYELENCKFTQIQSQTAALSVGVNGSGTGNSYFRFTNCTITFAAAGQNCTFYGQVIELFNCTVAGTATTTLFTNSGNQQGNRVYLEGCDLSTQSGTLVGDRGASGTAMFTFKNCKLHASATPKSAAATVLNKGETEVWLFNCNAADVNYSMAHYDALGSTVASSSIYANDGAIIDSTRFSMQITTTANCSYFTPYTSPWFFREYTGGSTITPAIEICRSGSATPYLDSEVWVEFLYQGTSGVPKSTLVSDRAIPPTTPANQATGDLPAASWTGKNATSWFGKLAPAAAISPAEVGTIAARVVMGKASDVVYADQTIRGF